MTKIDDVNIRTTLLPGDLGYVAYLHGVIYANEYGYGMPFEHYVLEGLADLAAHYDPSLERIWVCEDKARLVGFLAALHREQSVQLRYFLIDPRYRGAGLGRRLMEHFTDFVKTTGYRRAFLWTTHEQAHAHSLYRQFGFALKKEVPSDLFGKPVREQRWEWHGNPGNE